ncbi:MAG: EAL domain-containing protein, partial [Coriobacteriales bacterium]|nr:EAL domain-containing protein [Coriobacteriales bacterium]
LAIDLGRWVSATAIREFAEMRESHFTNLRMSINLHPRHLEEDRSFVSFLAELRDHYVVLPGEIEFEITEHMAVNASYAMSETFRQIRDLGFSLTIDDLGMGYSSLNYISDYGVHTVKIDMSLIDKIHDNYKQREIVRSVVLLAGQLNLELVVEGVETIEQVEALTKLGVRAFQGYYFSKPLMIEDFKAYFAEHH